MIIRLNISDLRVIEEVDIHPASGLNLIIGGNGAGKTSILEALYTVGRGRSFRHQDNGPIIREGREATTIYVDIQDTDGYLHKIGLRKERNSTVIRIDGRDARKRSELVTVLPLIWISPNSQDFIDRGPEIRRRFLDLGLFHVEHSYHSTYALFARLLKQRNSLLRARCSPNELDAWDALFVDAALTVDGHRKILSQSLQEIALSYLADWDATFNLSIDYRSGWRKGFPLADELDRKRTTDLEQGYTGVGPQRSDWEIRAGDTSSRKRLSRGQQKMLVIALNLAMARMWISKGTKPIFAIDDLSAELEMKNRKHVLHSLESLGCQVFITAIDGAAFGDHGFDKVFHVEHGRVS